MSTGDIPGHPNAQEIFSPGETGDVLLGLGSTLEFLMLAAVGARLYAKHNILRRWTPDDFTCIAATISTTAYFIAGCYTVTTAASTSMAAGYATEDFLISTWLTQWLSPLAFVFAKLSFFLLYMQIFRPIATLRVAALIGAIYCTLLWAFLLIFRLVAITPRPGATWNVVQSGWGAQTNHLLVLIAGPFDIVSDLHIVILPLVGINKLRINGKKKLGVIAIILTGLLAVIASAISMYYRVGYAAESKTQHAFYSTTLCVIVELQIGVLCCSMPAVSALLRHHFASWDTSSRGMSRSHPYNLSRHTFADASGKSSRYSRTVATKTTEQISATDSTDAHWKSDSLPQFPGSVVTAVREVPAYSDQRFELDDMSIDSTAGGTRPQSRQYRQQQQQQQQGQSFQFDFPPPSSPSPLPRSRQNSRRGSLLLNMVPSVIRPSPRVSRQSSVKRSMSPWGVRSLFDERDHDPNALLGDSILVETDIHVMEEERWRGDEEMR